MGWFLTSRRYALTIVLVKICNLPYSAAVADGVVIFAGHRAIKIGYLECVSHFG